MPSQSDIRRQVTDQIIAPLKSGDLPQWKKRWRSLTGPHRNEVSGRSYSGVNILLYEFASKRLRFTSSIWERTSKPLHQVLLQRPKQINPAALDESQSRKIPVVSSTLRIQDKRVPELPGRSGGLPLTGTRATSDQRVRTARRIV